MIIFALSVAQKSVTLLLVRLSVVGKLWGSIIDALQVRLSLTLMLLQCMGSTIRGLAVL